MLHTYPSKIIINADHLVHQPILHSHFINCTTSKKDFVVASNKNNCNQTNFWMKTRRQNFIYIRKFDNWNILFTVIFHIGYCFFVNRYQYRWYPNENYLFMLVFAISQVLVWPSQAIIISVSQACAVKILWTRYSWLIIVDLLKMNQMIRKKIWNLLTAIEVHTQNLNSIHCITCFGAYGIWQLSTDNS